MRIDRFLSQNRIIELKSRDFAAALGELLDVALPAGTPAAMRDTLRRTLEERQASMPTSVGGNYITVPNVVAMIDPPFVFAVGRLPEAEPVVPAPEPAAQAPAEGAPVPAVPPAEAAPPAPVAATLNAGPRIIFLVLASSKTRMYHRVLSEIAHALADADFLTRIRGAASLKDFRAEISKLLKGVSRQAQDHESGMNRLIGKAAQRLARGTKCSVMLMFADTFRTPPLLEHFVYPTFKVVIVSEENYDFHSDAGEKPEVITVRSFGNHRMSQLRAAMFIGLMRGIIRPSDRVCCIGGTSRSNRLDSVLVIDVANEFPTVMTSRANDLVPQKVRPEVLERTIALATELAVEGREGKPVGTMFVVGECEKIRPHTRPLLLNPLSGFAREDRNITGAFVEETVKELALIDGAFVIDHDGVIDSAGSQITATYPGAKPPLASGYGTRHAAAWAISKAVDCAAVVVSASGQITLFRHGEPIVLLERSASRTI